MLQTKNSGIPLDTKDVDDAGTIEGYASIFGNVDSYGEIVEPGAFVKSLDRSQKSGRKIKMLWQHDPHQPIGVWDELAEDKKGLKVRGRLLIDQSPKAREAHGLLQAGALDGLSIGYRTIKSGPKEGKSGVISLTELDLLENSVVTFAANERARVEVVKSILGAGETLTTRQFEEFLREAGFSKSLAAAIAGKATPHLRGEPDEKVDDVMAFLNGLRT
jgi:HK97 family phage prohead protease